MNTNKAPFPAGALLAAYLRDSGGEEQDLSVPQQEAEARRFCDANGYILTRIFIDAARPGSSVDSRYGFQEMMHHFHNDAPEAGIIVWKYSRFAREIDDAAFYKADLRRRGYMLYSLTDSVPDGLDGRLFEAIISWKDARFLEDLSTDVKRGLLHIVQSYGAVPGIPPRGFKREAIHIGKRRDGSDHVVHRWVIDDSLVPLVQKAFELRAAGASYRRILEETRLYKSKNCLCTFFSNRLYLGELVFGDLIIEDYCEPLIDPDTWAKVQSRRVRQFSGDNPHHPRRTGENFALSGLLYCALCDAPMNGHVITGHGYYTYYGCSRRHRRHDCDALLIPQAPIEAAVMDTIKAKVLLPENIAAIQEELRLGISRRSEESQSERVRLERELSTVRQRLGNLAEAIAEHGGRTLLDKLGELEREEASLVTRLEALQERPIPMLSIPPDELSARLIAAIDTASSITLHTLLGNLIQRIVVYRDGNTIRGNLYHYVPSFAYSLCPHGEAIYTHELEFMV